MAWFSDVDYAFYSGLFKGIFGVLLILGVYYVIRRVKKSFDNNFDVRVNEAIRIRLENTAIEMPTAPVYQDPMISKAHQPPYATY
uniref:Copper transporter n=1 Tax=Steinernema glaseri TaxID=37863 RepID=A0A1I8AKA6_9BILA